jgi:hypothetical protein
MLQAIKNFFSELFQDHLGKKSSTRLLTYGSFLLMVFVIWFGFRATDPAVSKFALGVVENIIWLIAALVLWGQGSKAASAFGKSPTITLSPLNGISFGTLRLPEPDTPTSQPKNKKPENSTEQNRPDSTIPKEPIDPGIMVAGRDFTTDSKKDPPSKKQ